MQGQPLLPAEPGPALLAGGGAVAPALFPGLRVRTRHVTAGLAAGAGVYAAALPAVSPVLPEAVRAAAAGGVR